MSAPFVFVTSPGQYASCCTQGFYGPGSTVVASPFTAILDLETREHPHVNLWEYYRAGEIAGDEADAWALCEAVADAAAGQLLVDGVDLVRCIQNDLFSAFRFAFTAHRLVDRVLEEHQPDEVVHFAEMGEALYWDPPDPPADMFNAVVAHLAAQRDIPTRAVRLQGDAPAALPPVGDAAEPRPFQPAWLRHKFKRLAFAEASYCSEQGALLQGGHDRDRDWLLVSSITPTAHTAALPLAEFRSFPFAMEKMDQQIAGIRATFPACLGAQAPAITGNPLLGFVWDSWAAWLRETAINFQLGRFLGAAYRPETTVMGSDVAGACRAFAAGIRLQAGAVIAIDHWGTKLERTHDRQRGARNHAAVAGEYELKGHREHRPADMQSRAIGTLRSAVSLDFEPAVGAEPRSTESVRIVVFTAMGLMHGNLFACAHCTAFRETWKAFLGLCRAHPEWDVTIKPHPVYDYGEYYTSEPFAKTPNIQYTPDVPIDEALAGADLAIIMNIQTWVLPEIIARGVPVVYVKDAIALGPIPQMDAEGAVQVDQLEALEGTISSLVNDAAVRGEVLHKARRFLAKAVSATGEQALLNLEAFADEVAEPTRAPDPAARWITNMMLLLAHFRFHGMPWQDFLQQLKVLKKEGRSIDFASLPDIDLPLVGPYFMHFFMREPVVWPVSIVFPLRAAWNVFWSIPQVLRPDRGLLRSCGTLAYEHASAQTENGLLRSWYTLCLFAVAPGKLLSR